MPVFAISIEDVLPFFPDFVVIDAFKTEICAKLEEYNRNIEGLKSEIEDYTESAENIRKEIGALNSKPMHVSCSEKCALRSAYPQRAFLRLFERLRDSGRCAHEARAAALERVSA